MKTKDTLFLGKTDFPMRGNLPNKEQIWQETWEKDNLYKKRQVLNAGKPSFVLHDGPPFSNGNIHIGHALNKISKDIIIRYKSMTGYNAPFIPGWDTHGLPIEQVLTNKGIRRKELSLSEYRKQCFDYALTQVDKQKSDFKRLGISADWETPYLTLNKSYEAEQIRVFGKMAEKGYIYRGLKPIYWSPSSESSLAEAEIEYKDVRSPSIYVAFKVKDGGEILDEETSFIIWTTTPWTLPSNMAIAVKADGNYSILKVDGKKYVVASKLAEDLAETLEWKDIELLKEIKGIELENLTAQHPFYDRESRLILGDHVTFEDGTGLVHTSPGHGEEDFIAAKLYSLPVLSPIDERGYFTEEAPGFEGVFYDNANKLVTEKLKENDALLKLQFITHSYPHDWRTKKPVIYRATPQWFASINDFRDDILEAIQEVNWIQPWGMQRIYNMVRDRGDWVISRQRAWGVPLPIFYAENGDAIISRETTEHVAQLFAEYGSNIWFEREAKELLPEGFEHPSSPNGKFTKETDIMDVWFDSGSSHSAVLKQRKELSYPADMYLEGSDQYRGWFNSSLTTSVAVNNSAPYKSVLSQGFVLDGNGKKMSKSLGNTIIPNKVIQQFGADILRLWVSSVDYDADVRVSMEILKQISESYRKIRNTMRFMLSNIADYDDKDNKISFSKLRSVDKYMIIKLHKLIDEVRERGFEKYDFLHVYRQIINFINSDLSAFYLDIAKDVVYIEETDNFDRRCMQTVFFEIVLSLTKLLTPILPHTSEEIWSYLNQEEEYVQLSEFPEAKDFSEYNDFMELWKDFMALRNDVLKALEEARNDKVIGKSLEAKVTIYPNKKASSIYKKLDSDLSQLFILSSDYLKVLPVDSLNPENSINFENQSILVEKAEGHLCQRCRKIKKDIGIDPNLPDFCTHCTKIVNEHFPNFKVSE
ncbi:isoleucine--tRNA ligase [Marinilactibacillus psychrotolerans]|uniref:isoleucine--tRNA ligase n=1 Tax=Marinilactibacillus psychrotolerans TaxID=191770 RepID=UPI0038850690